MVWPAPAKKVQEETIAHRFIHGLSAVHRRNRANEQHWHFILQEQVLIQHNSS